MERERLKFGKLGDVMRDTHELLEWWMSIDTKDIWEFIRWWLGGR